MSHILKRPFISLLLAGALTALPFTVQAKQVTQPAGQPPTLLDLGQSIDEPFCEDSARVMGGCTISIEDFPWMVSLGDAHSTSRHDGHFCGGTAIADRWILTAAHCVDGGTLANSIAVYAGSASLDGGGRIVDVARIFTHPGYGGVGTHDIALLELISDIGVETVRLAAAGDVAEQAGTDAVITGWGLTPPPQVVLGQGNLTVAERQRSNAPSGWEISRVLLGGAVPVVNPSLCDDEGTTVVCAGFEEARADACRGDSGGPLHGIVDDEYIQIGLVSGGNYCHQDGDHYGTYTRVSAYADWIASVQAGEVAEVTVEPDLNLQPTFGAEILQAGFSPDPFQVEIRAGGSLDAATLGQGCAGHIAQAPDYIVYYKGNDGGMFSLFVEGDANTTLAVNTPDGTWQCSAEDGQGHNPAITWPAAEPGRYAVYIGTVDPVENRNYPSVQLLASHSRDGRG